MSHPRADELVSLLKLKPHPEGGRYVELYRSEDLIERDGRDRSAGTAIHFLLERGQQSRWHVVDADEIWHFNEGDPLELLNYDPSSGELGRSLLGPADERGTKPMAVVRRGVWQAARPCGDYTLVACTVSPGFEFAGFALCAELPGGAEEIARMPEELRSLA
jgi:hypothetical protein